jgi:glycosyltransferase involved in cell wall biosynthesis
MTDDGALKVGLCGNIANNAYNMTRILRDQGVFAQLLDDEMDLFPFSRPVWEERDLVLSFEEVMEHAWLPAEWRRLETRLGWDPGDLTASPGPGPSRLSRLVDRLRRGRPERRLAAAKRAGALSPDAAAVLLSHRRRHQAAVAWMRRFDVIIAFGFHAAVCAFFADRPTIYFTYGGDCRVQLKNDAGAALAQAFAFVLHDPRFVIDAYGCDQEIDEILRGLGLAEKAAYACLPNVNIALLDRPRDGARIRREIGWPADGLIFFMASRVDERWKRSSLFLDAFAQFAPSCPQATLVVTGWGKDFEAARARLAARSDLDGRVLLLSESVSKPRLFDLYAAADVIVDQFAVGSLGSVSFEALRMGKPVLTYLAPFNLLGYPDPPPLLNARTRADILRCLHACAERPEELADIGRRAAAWSRSTYAPENLVRATRGLARLGPGAWREYAPARARTLPTAAIPVPDYDADIVIAPWPEGRRAAIAVLDGRAPDDADVLDARLKWLQGEIGARVPVSLSLPVIPRRSGAIGCFPVDGASRATADAARLAELTQAGIIAAFDGYGGAPPAVATREQAAAWLERLQQIGAVPPVWADRWPEEGDAPCPFDLSGGPGGGVRHGDLLTQAGTAFFCLTRQRRNDRGFGPPPAGPGDPDPVSAAGGEALVVYDRLSDGTGVRAFRHAGAGSEAFLRSLLQSGAGGVIRARLPVGAAPEADPAFAWLRGAAAAVEDGVLWAPPLGLFLNYCETIAQLRFDIENVGAADGAGVVLRLYALGGGLREADLRGVELRLNGDFPLRGVELRDGDGAWRACREFRLRDGLAGSPGPRRRLLSWPL